MAVPASMSLMIAPLGVTPTSGTAVHATFAPPLPPLPAGALPPVPEGALPPEPCWPAPPPLWWPAPPAPWLAVPADPWLLVPAAPLTLPPDCEDPPLPLEVSEPADPRLSLPPFPLAGLSVTPSSPAEQATSAAMLPATASASLTSIAFIMCSFRSRGPPPSESPQMTLERLSVGAFRIALVVGDQREAVAPGVPGPSEV